MRKKTTTLRSRRWGCCVCVHIHTWPTWHELWAPEHRADTREAWKSSQFVFHVDPISYSWSAHGSAPRRAAPWWGLLPGATKVVAARPSASPARNNGQWPIHAWSYYAKSKLVMPNHGESAHPIQNFGLWLRGTRKRYPPVHRHTLLSCSHQSWGSWRHGRKGQGDNSLSTLIWDPKIVLPWLHTRQPRR